ncbi:Response regulator receiver domain-containing protein [Massilia sp. PDC64]|nr:Response regulator receiver domain-containing protein [Massilia sp. PDC64]
MASTFDRDHASMSKSAAMLRKVLVVDDDRDLADMTATLLGLHGLTAMVAYSATEALERLRQDPEIDAMVSDVVMPAMNGVELAEQVQALYPAVKIVLVSGYALPGLLAKREKPFLYTSKPYRIKTLLGLLHT